MLLTITVNNQETKNSLKETFVERQRLSKEEGNTLVAEINALDYCKKNVHGYEVVNIEVANVIHQVLMTDVDDLIVI